MEYSCCVAVSDETKIVGYVTKNCIIYSFLSESWPIKLWLKLTFTQKFGGIFCRLIGRSWNIFQLICMSNKSALCGEMYEPPQHYLIPEPWRVRHRCLSVTSPRINLLIISKANHQFSIMGFGHSPYSVNVL